MTFRSFDSDRRRSVLIYRDNFVAVMAIEICSTGQAVGADTAELKVIANSDVGGKLYFAGQQVRTVAGRAVQFE